MPGVGRAGHTVHRLVHPFEPAFREPMLDLTLRSELGGVRATT